MKLVVCHDLQNKKYKVKEEKLIFRPSVYGILIQGNKVLLSRQWDGYDFPGGGVEIHETIESALKREFFEETGLKIKPIRLVHSETSFFHPKHSPKNKNEYWNCPLIYFLVKKVGGQFSKKYLDEEEKKYADLPEWLEINRLDRFKFYNSVNSPAIIRQALKIKNRL